MILVNPPHYLPRSQSRPPSYLLWQKLSTKFYDCGPIKICWVSNHGRRLSSKFPILSKEKTSKLALTATPPRKIGEKLAFPKIGLQEGHCNGMHLMCWFASFHFSLWQAPQNCASRTICIAVILFHSYAIWKLTAVWTRIEMCRDFFVKTCLTFFWPNNSSN